MSRRGPRTALVAAQVAISLVLVTGAGLFTRSLSAALSLNAELDAGRIVTASVALDPGVDEHYFSTMGLPIVSGRFFSPSEIAGLSPVAVVSESLGRLIAGGGDPIGRRIAKEIGGELPGEVEIIGVVPDVVTDVNSVEPLRLYLIAPPDLIAESMVVKRRREMSIRAALGASGAHLGALVLRDTARLVGIGLIAGLGLKLLVGRAMRALLYQVAAFRAFRARFAFGRRNPILSWSGCNAMAGGVLSVERRTPVLRCSRW